MRRIIAPFIIILFAATTLVSCFSDENEDVARFGDTGINSFVISNMKVYVTTKSSKGEDSTYFVRQSGASFNFRIDQKKNEIYNPDSLPYGTDAAKLLVTVGTVNNGRVGLKMPDGKEIRSITNTDSLDFTTPRTLVILSNDGKNTREYTVKVNVHKQKAYDFKWTMLANNTDIAAFKMLRAFEIGGQIVVYGSDGVKTTALQTGIGDGKTWQPLPLNLDGTLDANAFQGIVKKGDRLYVMHDGKLLSSANGGNWEVVATPNVKKLVAASGTKLFAINAEGRLASSTDGAEWTTDGMDGGTDLLPATDICYACMPLRTNNDIERVVLIGNRGAATYTADTTAVVWGKIDDNGNNAVNMPWAYYVVDGKNKYVMPRLAGLSMTKYGERLLAVGGKGIPPCKTAAYDKIYTSADGGITWKNDISYQLPGGIDKNAAAMALATDTDRHLWIICAGTGQVWRGRLNKLGWK
ncbi:DUF6242 domain-containing protein [Prevotella sp. OH937_COT-195]|uniref:DUF6242 domain-containing protein n=1 Tax=Prevotella sp. OH937_COT-195 TaxID=2491051 RepID=UPI000F647C17|nr:DUF6242 domain-containing protein [Prevotella sp. OH937_COT-195]RRD00257.1 hypothetical protein EII32_07030 [Prevotella sp. OH937_COT-195]